MNTPPDKAPPDGFLDHHHLDRMDNGPFLEDCETPEEKRALRNYLEGMRVAWEKERLWIRNWLNNALRTELVRLAKRKTTRDRFGAAVAERLQVWAAEARIEGFVEWLDAKGWTALEERSAYLAQMEAALVAAWQDAAKVLKIAREGDRLERGYEPAGDCWIQFMHLESLETPESESESVLVQACMTTPRGTDLPVPPWAVPFDLGPPFGPEWFAPTGIRRVHALDGLKILLGRENYWKHLAEGLANGEDFKWLRLLAAPWITEKAEKEKERAEAEAERLKREAEAVALATAPRVRVKDTKGKDHDFRRLPKVAGAFSWAFGGPGVELSRVTVDGRDYAPAPELAIVAPSALVPAGYALLPEDHDRRPHQTLLPIDLQGEDDAPPLPVALVNATQYAIIPHAGKLGVVIMGAAHAGKGKLHKTNLRDLTKTINPAAPQLLKTHYETVCKGLVQLDALRLVLPNGLAYRVFDCPIPWRTLKPEEYDTDLFVGLSQSFVQTLDNIHKAAGASYRGDFLFDLTGAMLLPTNKPGLLRQYIRAAAFWNAYWKPENRGEPDPSRVPAVAADRWAALTNNLPPAAVEYLRSKGKKGDRRRLADSIKDTVREAEALEAAGLVQIVRADTTAVHLLPPPEYLEAWRESRKGAHKIPGKGGE